MNNSWAWYDRNGPAYVPRLIRGPWTFLTHKNPIPCNVLASVGVHPFAMRLVSTFVLLPDKVSGGSGMALVCFRSPQILRR